MIRRLASRLLGFAFIAAFVALLPGVARADAVPGDACTTANAYTLSGGPETSGTVYLMTCQSGAWVRVMEIATSGNVGIGTPTPQTSLDLSGKTDALLLQTGTTGQRPTGVAGMIRYNSTTPAIEAYYSGAWNTLLTSTSTLTGNLTLGSTATATNPSRSGDPGTGLFSGTASTVSIATAGVEALRVSATGSVGIGTTSPAQALDVTGNINVSAITGGYYLANTKILGQPASDTTSIAVGPSALAAQTATNLFNTAVGYSVLNATTTGTGNTAVGYQTLHATTTGASNTGVGFFALNTNTTGSSNTANGVQALQSNTTGSSNTANGVQALQANTTGSNNLALGYQVGKTTLTTGSNNILIGTSSLVDTTASNSSNQLNIGNLIYGDMAGVHVGIGSATINSGAALDLSSQSNSLLLPTGTTGQQPGSPAAGMIRYNSTTPAIEAYYSGAWNTLVGGSIATTLGTTATSTSPSRSGDLGTGLYSYTASTVSVATAGTQALTITATQSIGVGTTSPVTSVDFSAKTDGLLLQTASAAAGASCASTLKGAIRYNSNLNNIEYCDGSNWNFFAASTSSCGAPSGLTFTNLTDQYLNTSVSSNIATITFTGCATGQSVSVSGAATAQISINGGAWVTSGLIASGQTLQVRLTSSNTISTTLTATVTVGGTSTNWTVTTKAGNTRIFLSSNSYNGNFGGLSGADAVCNTEASSLGYSGYWMAILSDAYTSAKDRLTITYPVVRASATSTTVASSNLWGGTLANAISATSANTWTGTDSSGTKNYNGAVSTNTWQYCSNWTYGGGGGTAAENGTSASTTTTWAFATNVICSNAYRIYCIEQPTRGCAPTGATTFTNLTNQAVSTLVTSASITPTGCATTSNVLVTGLGSPQISINGGAWATSGTMNPGDSIQVRLTTSSAYNTAYYARVDFGTATTTWTATTTAGGSQVFVTSGTYNGNLGGLLGADTICQAAATAAGYSATYWMAILSDAYTNAKDRLTITYPVVRASDGALVASSTLWGGAISNAIGSFSSAWTGTDSTGTKDYNNAVSTTPSQYCSNWTNGSGSTVAELGSAATNSQWTQWSVSSCISTSNLFCISVPSPGCSPTGATTFTNLTSQAVSTLVTSASITPTGCGATSTVLVGGNGSPQISINGGAWTTSGTMNAGDTLQVRLTTSSAYNATYTAEIFIGGVRTLWTATTTAGGSQVFQTSGTYNGNLGGLSGADAVCASAASALGYSGTWMAIMSDSATNAKDRLTITYPVVRASDGVVVAAANLWGGSLSAAIGVSTAGTNTGTSYTGIKNSPYCTDWTSSSSGVSGYGGAGNATNSTWAGNGAGACNNNYNLYCISQ
jgi:hypothetical protein